MPAPPDDILRQPPKGVPLSHTGLASPIQSGPTVDDTTRDHQVDEDILTANPMFRYSSDLLR